MTWQSRDLNIFSVFTHGRVKAQGTRLVSPQGAVGVRQATSLVFAPQAKLTGKGYLRKNNLLSIYINKLLNM